MGVAGASRGYILEVFDGHFQLPNLGPIGEFVGKRANLPKIIIVFYFMC